MGKCEFCLLYILLGFIKRSISEKCADSVCCPYQNSLTGFLEVRRHVLVFPRDTLVKHRPVCLCVSTWFCWRLKNVSLPGQRSGPAKTLGTHFPASVKDNNLASNPKRGASLFVPGLPSLESALQQHDKFSI